MMTPTQKPESPRPSSLQESTLRASALQEITLQTWVTVAAFLLIALILVRPLLPV
jgi:hypothetical protein